MTLLQWLDYAAVFVFALTGALAASRAQLDIVGFLFLGCLTAVGPERNRSRTRSFGNGWTPRRPAMM